MLQQAFSVLAWVHTVDEVFEGILRKILILPPHSSFFSVWQDTPLYIQRQAHWGVCIGLRPNPYSKRMRGGSTINKNRGIFIRISDEELQEIDARAVSLQMSRSKFIIQAALNQTVIMVGRDELKALTTQLRKIGININHITTLCNMGKIQCVSIGDTNKELTKIWEGIDKLRKDIKREMKNMENHK